MNQYKTRIIELNQANYSISDIGIKIHKEYGIRLKSDQIEKIASVENFEVDSDELDEKSTLKMIENVLSASNFSMTAREISQAIRTNYEVRVVKSRVNSLIFKYLRGNVNYDRYLFKYTWKSNLNESSTAKLTSVKSILDNQFKPIVGEFDSVDFSEEIKSYFRDNLIKVSTGIDKIDYLIKSVVKDNKITECEEIFLKTKAKEFGYSDDIILKAKKSLEDNNPYLDNLIHIIFDDGIITEDEVVFLREKAIENNFTETFVNERFWIIGLAEYFQHLVDVKPLDQVVTLFYILQKSFPEKFSLSQFLSSLSIFKNSNLSILSTNTKTEITDIFNKSFSEKLNTELDYASHVIENMKFHENHTTNNSSEDTPEKSLNRFMKILNQEKLRIGSPDVNLLVENINFRIENNLWD